MSKRSTNIILLLAIFCASFLSYSQEQEIENEDNEEVLSLLKDADDNQIKFENHYFEALKYKAIGNHTRAITELENCQQLYPDNSSIEFEFAKNYFLLNKFEEALNYIEKSLKTDNSNYWSLDLAKKIYLKQYNYTKAIETQEKMVVQNPTVIDDLILLYIQANEREKAKKLILEVENNGIASSKTIRYKQIVSNTQIQKTIPKKAIESKNNSIETLKKSFENNKQFPVLKEILIHEFTNGNYKSLLEYSTQAIELFPSQPYVYLMNGKALINFKKYNDAIDVLNNGIDFLIDDATLEIDFYEQLVTSYNAINQHENANKSLQKIQKLKTKKSN